MMAVTMIKIRDFQRRVLEWFEACFSAQMAKKRKRRLYAFFEEANELIQSGGMTREEAHAMVDHVFNREPGEFSQEVAGVFTTLCMVANSHDIDLEDAGEKELARIWEAIPIIQAKQAQKLRPNDEGEDG